MASFPSSAKPAAHVSVKLCSARPIQTQSRESQPHTEKLCSWKVRNTVICKKQHGEKGCRADSQVRGAVQQNAFCF